MARKLMVSQFVTLDGVMESPENWNAHYLSDPELVDEILADFAACDLMVYGATTYQFFASRWPARTSAMADHLNTVAKVVISSSLREASWQNSTIVNTDARKAIVTLKQQPGKNILMLGSHRLMQTLMAENLVDGYKIYVHPLTLGTGKQLFESGQAAQTFKLVKAQPMASGVVALTYQAIKN